MNFCSAMWYQWEDEREEFGVQLAKDIAVGAIVSFMVFPINIVIVFLFKKSKVKVEFIKNLQIFIETNWI